MVWPPTTHQDVEDELDTIRTAHADYFRTGYYSAGAFLTATPANATLTAGSAYVRPFWIQAPRTFDRIGINVSTAATAASGGTIALAIYQPGPGQPGPLLLETATVSSETTGAKEFTINATLDAGVWWVGVRAVTAGCGVTSAATAGVNPFVMASTTPVTAGQGCLVSFSGATAFPNPWVTSTSSISMQLVSLRAA